MTGYHAETDYTDKHAISQWAGGKKSEIAVKELNCFAEVSELSKFFLRVSKFYRAVNAAWQFPLVKQSKSFCNLLLLCCRHEKADKRFINFTAE